MVDHYPLLFPSLIKVAYCHSQCHAVNEQAFEEESSDLHCGDLFRGNRICRMAVEGAEKTQDPTLDGPPSPHIWVDRRRCCLLWVPVW